MQLTISSSKIIKYLSSFSLILILIHSIILAIYFYINDPKQFNFIRLFDLDMERNIPTLFSSLLFCIASFLFYLLYKKEKTPYWLGLCVVFLFLAFDESAKIHESIGDFTENFIDASGYLFYPWVLSYALFVLILTLIYAKFFFKMPKKVFFSFMLSAIIFLTGAIGFDMLGGYEANLNNENTLTYCIYYTIEESLEMFGLIYLISILLGLLKSVEIKILS